MKNLLKMLVVVPGVLLAIMGLLTAMLGVGLTATGKYLLALADD